MTPAQADHTDPRKPQAPTEGSTADGRTRGEGDWQHVANFPGGASPALSGGGTDLEFFSPSGSKDVYGAFGTLGQDEAGSIGQRILRLTSDGNVEPEWVADHGSAHCQIQNTSITGLQHDSQVAAKGRVRLLTDTTDAAGRCHDPKGGGIEIIDVTGIADPDFEPREVHLVRFDGFSHTNTVDTDRPGIVYNSSSDFQGRNWIDVMDMRSCFGSPAWTLTERREACAPEVFRIPFEPDWTKQRDSTETDPDKQLEPGSASCHDITYSKDRLYCAALNATLIMDVSGLMAGGEIQGTPLNCPEPEPGARTGAMVTDCSSPGLYDPAKGQPAATGAKFLGTFQHPGRDCVPGADVRNCNTNNLVRSDEGVAVSHEADPTPDQQHMFVTDERGGGVVPPGSSCQPGIDNPFGNGGAHAFDISDPNAIEYTRTPAGDKAVYISDAVVSAATFCDIHVMELVPGEQRFIAAYYTQGIKIVDYYINEQGQMQFVERASLTLPNANTWAAEDFKVVDHGDGTKTYYLAVDDIHRGIDVVSWTGPSRASATPPSDSAAGQAANTGLLGLAALLLPGAAVYGRRRRSTV